MAHPTTTSACYLTLNYHIYCYLSETSPLNDHTELPLRLVLLNELSHLWTVVPPNVASYNPPSLCGGTNSYHPPSLCGSTSSYQPPSLCGSTNSYHPQSLVETQSLSSRKLISTQHRQHLNFRGRLESCFHRVRPLSC